MTEERHSGHTPPSFSSFIDEGISSTSREGAAGASSTLDDYTAISGEAWAHPWNTLINLSDATYVHEHADVNENGSSAYWLPLSSSGDNDANLSTRHAGMEESSTIWEDERIPKDNWGGQQNTQYYPDDVTSTIYESALWFEDFWM
ncbi:uncharacterized protein LOC125941295 [Dermacentor silvarum]|uniref:uncharacterized protein LOC125941295 n=1 Tax=Dermacentor silvarum TaxID=543639 RepID=UPI0021007DA0|nr:uncharacterized protein LOC125941295 [Dermacentor silvarum]